MFKPERTTEHAYFVLLQVGFTPLPYCYGNAGALTTRFHPYRLRETAVIFCGTIHGFASPLIDTRSFKVLSSFGVRTFLLCLGAQAIV